MRGSWLLDRRIDKNSRLYFQNASSEDWDSSCLDERARNLTQYGQWALGRITNRPRLFSIIFGMAVAGGVHIAYRPPFPRSVAKPDILQSAYRRTKLWTVLEQFCRNYCLLSDAFLTNFASGQDFDAIRPIGRDERATMDRDFSSLYHFGTLQC